jgi:hypothetical protein
MSLPIVNCPPCYPSGMSLTEIINMKIKEAQNDVNKSEQIQSLIHGEENMYKSSVNLMVGKRSSSKKLNVFHELIKIDILQYSCGLLP